MNSTSNAKISDFTNLIAWKSGHELVLLVYRQLKALPKEEKYNLIDQLRRASLSITNNLAEGFSRQSNKEKLQFYSISIGSLKELENCLLVCRDLNYISSETYDVLKDQSTKTGRLIYGLIRSTKLRVSD